MPAKPIDHDEDQEFPWTEDQWEAFLRHCDVRSARYGELFETLVDHPDREEIIDREMGWAQMREGQDEEEMAAHVEELNRVFDEATNDPDIDREMEERRSQLEALPAYQKGHAFALKVYRELKHLFTENEDEEPDEDFADLLGSSRLVGAKIAGGHTMGYRDDSIGGNIANCKRALKAAGQTLESLLALHERSVISTALFEELMPEAEEVRRLVEERVEELRERVWWD